MKPEEFNHTIVPMRAGLKEQARIFRMKEIEGYDSKEIMQITGCSAESLRQNLSRARRKILSDFTKLTRMRVKNNVDDTTGRTLS